MKEFLAILVKMPTKYLSKLHGLHCWLRPFLLVVLLAPYSMTLFAQSQPSLDLAQQMFVAYYGRPGDPDGWSYWADIFDNSSDLEVALDSFGNSDEFHDNFGNLSNQQLVNSLYRQMFNHDADPDGLNFYVERLARGEATLASIAKQIADGAANEDWTTLDNKILIANQFSLRIESEGADYTASDIPAAQAILSSVTAEVTSVESATEEVNSWGNESTETRVLALNSSEMTSGGNLPVTYTCDGEGISPPLSWSGAPEETTNYALIMHHVPGPDDTHWYWVMYDIDQSITSLQANEIQGTLGSNSVNDLNEYAPPCSQGPGIKSYTFTLYALSAFPDLTGRVTVDRDTLLNAMSTITLDSVEFSVNYERNTDISLTSCEVIQQSVSISGFDDIAVACDDEYAYITSDTYPDHDLMNGITGTNEQIPVPAQNYSAPIKLTPQFSDHITTIDAAVGVAVNGVPIYDYSSQGELDIYNYDINSDTLVLGQLDNCGGHAGRGDDYHYHAAPNCMLDSMETKGDDVIIGWGYDGYPLYGDNNPDGTSISSGELDVCNGQLDETFGYRYHTSANAPYIIQCLVGDVDTDILPRVAPLSGDVNGIRADLTPPQGGVENLTHTIAEDGTRTMSYTYNGASYYVTYSPSPTKDNCYDFEQKTVQSGGIIETGTFCR